MGSSRLRRAAAAIAILTLVPSRSSEAVLPVDVIPLAELGFGQIFSTSTSGTVTISPAGARTKSGGVVLGSGFGVSQARFTVAGDAQMSYSITLPGPITLSAGGRSMTVDGFISTPAGSGNLGTTGTQLMSVGATLHVGAGQVSAAYSGSLPLTVAYN